MLHRGAHFVLRRQFLPWLVLIIGSGITLLLWQNVKKYVFEETRSDFEFRVREINTLILQRMEAYEQVLRGARGLFDASESVTRPEFRAYINSLQIQKNYPGIQGIGFSKIIPASDKDRHIAEIRQEGFADYSIWPPGERDPYTSIVYLEPFTGRNLRAFGFDMYSEPARHEAMSRARDTGTAALSGRVTLVQETTENIQAGFLMYMPIYKKNVQVTTVAQRRNNIVGWVYAPFRMDDFMVGLRGERKPDVDIEIYDGKEITSSARMYDMFPDRSSTRLSISTRLEINDHYWTVAVHSLPEFEAHIDQSRPLLAAAIGTILSLLLTVIIWFLVHGRQRALQMADAMSRELKESEDQIRVLLNSTAEAIFGIDMEGKFTFCNKACLEQLGYNSASDLLGKDMHSTIHYKSADGTPYPDNQCRIKQALQKGEIAHAENEVLWRADGTCFPVEYWSHPKYSEGKILGAVVTFIDITERKRAKEELLRNIGLVNSLLDSIPDLIFYKDMNGIYLGCNPSFCEFVGKKKNEIIGKTDYDLFAKEIADFFREHDKLMLEIQRSRHNEEWITYPDGRKRLIDTLKTPYWGPDGTLIGVLGISRDITERKEAEVALKNLNESLELQVQQRTAELRKLTNELKRKNDELESILYTASHDLRSTLVNIQGFRHELFESIDCLIHRCETVALDEQCMAILKEDIPVSLDFIGVSTTKLDTILSGLLKLSRIGRQSIKKEVIDMNALLLSAAKSMDYKLRDARVKLDIQSLPPCYGDQSLLNGIFINLLDNAIKFRDQSRKPLIRVTSKTETDQVVYCVEDNGIGISQDFQKRIFEPFHRLDPSRTEGEGLGLSIIKRSLEMLGGEIWIESERGKGSKFYIALPRA